MEPTINQAAALNLEQAPPSMGELLNMLASILGPDPQETWEMIEAETSDPHSTAMALSGLATVIAADIAMRAAYLDMRALGHGHKAADKRARQEGDGLQTLLDSITTARRGGRS